MEMKFHIYRAESKISSQKFFDRSKLDENQENDASQKKFFTFYR